jgi:transposase
MMGERRLPQGSLFYEFRLEDHVPADHLVCSIDRFVDLAGIRRDLAPFYSAIGRPSIDPELMIRMLIVGYCFGIRSERRLCQEVHLNLAYRWFCRLDLTDAVPDHSTFSKNRHGRFRDSDLFRRLFETVLARCIAAGIVGGEAFGVDASLIKADANREDGIEPERWSPAEHASRATADISRRSTTRPSGRRRRFSRNTSRRSIPPRAGPRRIAARRISSMPPTISWTSRTPSSSMSRRPLRSGQPRTRRRAT